MKTRHIALTLGATILLAAFLFAIIKRRPEKQQSQDSLPKIGALLPITGPAATTGDQLGKAINLAVEDYSAKSGRKAQLVVEDSRNDPATGVAGFRKLATLDKVTFVIVSLSGISQAVTPVANAEKVPSFALASAPIAHLPNDYMLRWFIDGAGESRAMAEFVAKQGFRRISIIHINDDYGRVLLEEFKVRLKEKGLEPVSVEGFDRKNEDFRSMAFRAKEANPDAVYFIAYGRPLGIALRQSKEAGLNIPFLSTFGFEISGTRELAGPAAEGLVYSSINYGEGVDESEATRRFVGRFREAYKIEPSSDAALAYDLTITLLGATAPLNTPRQAVGKTFDTQFGALRLSDKLEVLAPVILKRIEGGHVSRVQQ